MIILPIFLCGLFFVQPLQADSATPMTKEDSVSIGFIPAKGAFHKGAPFIVLEAKVLAHHKSREIEKYFIALSKLASEGRTDNATQFHQPKMYIEAIYQGRQVRLFFSGESRLEKFSHYEKQWKHLHAEIFKYLNANVSPNYQFNSDAAKNAVPLS